MSSRIFSEQFDNKNYLLSETEKLLLSADIDLNPGPAEIPVLPTYGRSQIHVLIVVIVELGKIIPRPKWTPESTFLVLTKRKQDAGKEILFLTNELTRENLNKRQRPRSSLFRKKQAFQSCLACHQIIVIITCLTSCRIACVHWPAPRKNREPEILLCSAVVNHVSHCGWCSWNVWKVR